MGGGILESRRFHNELFMNLNDFIRGHEMPIQLSLLVGSLWPGMLAIPILGKVQNYASNRRPVGGLS